MNLFAFLEWREIPPSRKIVQRASRFHTLLLKSKDTNGYTGNGPINFAQQHSPYRSSPYLFGLIYPLLQPLTSPTRNVSKLVSLDSSAQSISWKKYHGEGGRGDLASPRGVREIQSSIQFGQLNSLFRSKLYVVYTYEFNRRYGVLI